MWLRLMADVALMGLGYYVGKEVGRMETVREELARAREAKVNEPDDLQTTQDSRPDDSGP